MRILQASQWITFLSIICLDTFVRSIVISKLEDSSRVIEMGPDNFLKAIRDQCKNQKSISYICNNLRLILPVAESVLQESPSTESNTHIQHNDIDKDRETSEIINKEEEDYYYPLEDEGVNQRYKYVPPPVTVQTGINFKQSGLKSKHKKRFAVDDAPSLNTKIAESIAPRNKVDVHVRNTTAEVPEVEVPEVEVPEVEVPEVAMSSVEDEMSHFYTDAETISSSKNETANPDEENEEEYGSGAEGNNDSDFSQEDKISSDNSKENEEENSGEEAGISAEVPEENILQEDENSGKEPKFFLSEIASRLFKPNALTLKIPPAAVFAATIAQWVDRYLIHTSTVEQARGWFYGPVAITILFKVIIVVAAVIGFVIKSIAATAAATLVAADFVSRSFLP